MVYLDFNILHIQRVVVVSLSSYCDTFKVCQGEMLYLDFYFLYFMSSIICHLYEHHIIFLYVIFSYLY